MAEDNEVRESVLRVNRVTAATILGVRPHILEQLSTTNAVSVSRLGKGEEDWNLHNVAKAFCIIMLVDKNSLRPDYRQVARRVNQILLSRDGDKFKDFFKKAEWKEVMKRADLQGLGFEGSSYDIKD